MLQQDAGNADSRRTSYAKYAKPVSSFELHSRESNKMSSGYPQPLNGSHFDTTYAKEPWRACAVAVPVEFLYDRNGNFFLTCQSWSIKTNRRPSTQAGKTTYFD